jgi:sortase (surface protein transpeptidase)
VKTALNPVGLDPDGSIEEPPVTQPAVTGWYALGVHPGDPGPAVIVGHVSGRPVGAPRAVPGVFAHLTDLRVGDEITVERVGAPAVRFAVYDRKTVPKDRFPTVNVYGNTPGPELRLITCGGRFRPEGHSYESNIIVWARATGT